MRVRGASKNNYHLIFFAYNGPGPHPCYKCGLPVISPWMDEQANHRKAFHIHHKDGDHDNNDPNNLIAVHADCHGLLHGTTRWYGVSKEERTVHAMKMLDGRMAKMRQSKQKRKAKAGFRRPHSQESKDKIAEGMRKVWERRKST